MPPPQPKKKSGRSTAVKSSKYNNTTLSSSSSLNVCDSPQYDLKYRHVAKSCIKLNATQATTWQTTRERLFPESSGPRRSGATVGGAGEGATRRMAVSSRSSLSPSDIRNYSSTEKPGTPSSTRSDLCWSRRPGSVHNNNHQEVVYWPNKSDSSMTNVPSAHRCCLKINKDRMARWASTHDAIFPMKQAAEPPLVARYAKHTTKQHSVARKDCMEKTQEAIFPVKTAEVRPVVKHPKQKTLTTTKSTISTSDSAANTHDAIFPPNPTSPIATRKNGRKSLRSKNFDCPSEGSYPTKTCIIPAEKYLGQRPATPPLSRPHFRCGKKQLSTRGVRAPYKIGDN